MIWTGGLEASRSERKWNLLGTIAAVVRWIEFLLITRPFRYAVANDPEVIQSPFMGEIRSLMVVINS